MSASALPLAVAKFSCLPQLLVLSLVARGSREACAHLHEVSETVPQSPFRQGSFDPEAMGW